MSQDILRRFQELKADEWATTAFWIEQGLLSGTAIEQYINQMVALRYELAAEYLDFARKITGLETIHHRIVISRCYAAMYQAARALVLQYRRHDQEDAQRLVKPISETLGKQWAQTFQGWRSIRNKVEYYPLLDVTIQNKGLEHYRQEALDDAAQFLREVQIYLAERGCQV